MQITRDGWRECRDPRTKFSLKDLLDIRAGDKSEPEGNRESYEDRYRRAQWDDDLTLSSTDVCFLS